MQYCIDGMLRLRNVAIFTELRSKWALSRIAGVRDLVRGGFAGHGILQVRVVLCIENQQIFFHF